ncbi:MAG: autotransporter assembly complex family protein [Pseudomonadota bacterium]
MKTASPAARRPARYLRLWSAALSLCLLYLPLAVAQQTLELNISGVDGLLRDNVRAHLGLSQYVRTTPGLPVPLPLPGMAGPPELPAADEIRRLHRRAEKDIMAALQPYGYYEPDIETALEQQGEHWIASYRIVPGPPVLLQSVDITISGAGAEDPGLARVRERTRLRLGKRLQHPYYDDTREQLIQAALEAGYLDARYTKSELRVTPAKHRADAVLHLDTGPRFYFGPVTVEQDILKPGFVSRYVQIKEGAPFDTGKLLDLQLALGDSGYFDQVELEVQRAAAQEQHVPVIVHTKPGAHTRYTLGLGYGTDTGPRVSLGADYPRINRRGHGLKNELRLSPVQQNAVVNYTIPIRNLVSDRLVFSGEWENAEVASTGSTRGYKLGVSQNVSLGKLQRRLYVNYQHDTFDLGTERETVNFLIPGAAISKLKSDNVLFPRRGYSWNADLRGSPGVISSTRYFRTEASMRGVYPLGSKGRLLGRAQLGYTTVVDFDKLPASERFFAGGDQSVRGYGYQKLAPVDSSGEVIGGQYLAVGSVELDYLFVGNFGAALFLDAGNADDTFPPKPKLGAGIGFRWRSPVGMLRVDLAHPFDDPDNKFRLHISIGPDL